MPASTPFFQAHLGLGDVGEAATAQAAASGSITIPGFAQWCQPQPPGSNWCWAAVGKAMVGFARGDNLSLKQVAAKMRSPPPNLMEAYDIMSVLDVLRILHLDAIDLPSTGTAVAPEVIAAGMPLAISIVWFGERPGTFEPIGHVIAAFGWDPATRRLAVFDPNTVGASSDIIKAVPIDEMSHYLEGAQSRKRGTWGDGFAVRPNAG